MNITGKICIGIIIIVILLFAIGTLMTQNEINNNMEKVNITNSCSVDLPKDIDFKRAGGTDNEGTFISLIGELGGDWGRLIVDYEQSNNITPQSNQTKPYHDVENDIYSCWVYNGNGHEKVEIRGDNPAIVEKVAGSVKFA